MLLIGATSCDMLDKARELSAEDAKMEIRAAGDDIMVTMSEMMETPPMVAMNQFSSIMGMGFGVMKSGQSDDVVADRSRDDFKAVLTQWLQADRSFPVPGASRVMNVVRATNASNEDDPEKGVFHYNFDTGEFDLVNPNVSYLEYHYPADEDAMTMRDNNCVLRISNLEYKDVVVEDEFGVETDRVPTKFDITQKIDDELVMSMSYNATVKDNGFPESTSMEMDMLLYSMSLTLKGSSREVTVVSSLKYNKTDIFSTDLKIRYTADEEMVEKLDGTIEVNPLRFKGSISPEALEECGEDLSCMNKNIDMAVHQTEINRRIGKLEFRSYVDPEWDEEEIQLVVVYKDGTYEFLAAIFGDLNE